MRSLSKIRVLLPLLATLAATSCSGASAPNKSVSPRPSSSSSREEALATTVVDPVSKAQPSQQTEEARSVDLTLSQCVSGSEAPEPPRLRRLSEREWKNTVSSLFRLPRDLVESVRAFASDGFDNHFSNQSRALTLELDTLKLYLAQVARLEDAAFAALSNSLGCENQDVACLNSKWPTLMERAWRRPPKAEEISIFRLAFNNEAALTGPRGGFSVVFKGLLVSPSFLYRTELLDAPGAALNMWELATAVSYALTGSPPDEPLTLAAKTGALAREEVLRTHVDRLLESEEFERHFVDFLREWYGLNRYSGTTPELQEGVYKDKAAVLSLALTAVEGVRRDASLSELYSTTDWRIDTSVAQRLGIQAMGPGFSSAAADPSKYRGILTHPGIIGLFRSGEQTHPQLRGVFIAERVLCLPISAPPPSNIVSAAQTAARPGMTAREKAEATGALPQCAACHKKIDPLAFPFEAYSPEGAWRTHDAGKLVNISSRVEGVADLKGDVDGPVAMATKLASSRYAHECATRHAFRYLMARAEGPGDECAVAATREASLGGGSFKEIVRRIVLHSNFRTRKR
jgi:hypothetical protein